MAEKEVKKEKASFNINIWFVLFIVYLIFSVAFILNQNQSIETLNAQIGTLNYQIENNVKQSNARTNVIISKLESIVNEYKNSLVEEENNTPVVPEVPEVTVSVAGTYAGSAENMQMTLTLAENNVASLTVTNESNTSSFDGTYSLANDTVIFTSNDATATYSFTSLEDGNLKLVDSNVELTLSK